MAGAAERRGIVLGAFRIWGALLVLGVASLAYAVIPGLPWKPVAALAIVLVQAALVLSGFMRLRQASGLVRMTALVGIVWLSFLFLMAFADLWTR